jgi:predicted deacetylase
MGSVSTAGHASAVPGLSARYLVRLDDACHGMNRRRWRQVEDVLDRSGVKPIVAVVPDNRDPKLMADERDEGFWDKVRAWQAKDWTVAMHGYTHEMHPTDSPLLLPFYSRSEFAGLDLRAQAARIKASWQQFLAQGVTPTVWVAPAHSFDALTLQAIHQETPIRVISDGIGWDSYCEYGFHWIPQQLWEFAERRSGLWTVCLHPNTMNDQSIASLNEAIGGTFRERIGSVKDVVLKSRTKTWLDRLYREYFWWRWRQAKRAST